MENKKDKQIYNLIILLSEQMELYIDNEDFIDYICDEADISPDEYFNIMNGG